MTEPIPQEVLDAVYRKMVRRIGAQIINAMAQTDVIWADLDARLGVEPGTARRWTLKFIDAKGGTLRTMSELAYAIGADWHFEIHRLPPPEPDEEAPDQDSETGDG